MIALSFVLVKETHCLRAIRGLHCCERVAPFHNMHLGPDAISYEVKGISLDFSANWMKFSL